ncbi:MAG: Lrp/AsnC family transcriptional regulator [Phycisphaerales bacterium]|nr:Lrp/AsnC family transcriptional regulator [Phycisphaerales bacterium]
MDELKRRLINEWQGDFPLCERPFAVVAEQLNSDEATVLQILQALLADGTLTRFGPLYQIERMGGAFSLAALQVPEADFERIAAIVNHFPEVAHNYQRDHTLNMWFVLATETSAEMADTVARIEKATGLPVFNFPKEKEYFIEARFGVGASGVNHSRSTPDSIGKIALSPERLAQLRPLIRATQAGLPLTLQPYHALATQLNSDVTTVITGLQSLLEAGAIRRIGVVPNHYRIGYTANGMSVWNVADEKVDELGAQVGALQFVTHCYRRPRHLPHWPYNLFAMIHGASRDEVATKVEQIAEILGEDCDTRTILYSTRILKKTGLRLRG